MKIGILTHYNVNNQGAQLQMYALYSKIRDLGHTPKILTYDKNFDFEIEDKLKNQVSIKSVPYYLKNYLIKKGVGLTIHNTMKYLKNRKFRLCRFIHEHYATADIDMAIIGSDEVFSLESGVNFMMYGHAVNTENIISYAPSFGQTDINRIDRYHCRDLIVSGLLKFKAISARDENTAMVIEKLVGIKPMIVCDPVILYDFKNISLEKVKLPKQKYLVVYAYDRHMVKKDEVEAIKAYAKRHGLITVSPGTYHRWCDMNITCNCIEWIEFFRRAEAVITDTYHGTILSAITNVPMAIYIRNEINSNKLVDLIKRLDINDRRLQEINKQNIEQVFSKELNKDKINKTIENMRKKGENYLIKAIEACSK